MFHYRDDELWVENVPISKLVNKLNTPFYLYSAATIRDRFNLVNRSIPEPHIIAYSLKANPNYHIIRLMLPACGADVVSKGELFRALLAGVDPQKIVYAGVGKRPDEIRYALENRILMLNVESAQELQAIEAIATEMQVTAGVGIRVNPNIKVATHKYDQTAVKGSKFGIPEDEVWQLIPQILGSPSLNLLGIHVHLGSEITEVEPFRVLVDKMYDYYMKLKTEYNYTIKYINLGGGWGKSWEGFPIDELGNLIHKKLRKLPVTIIVEPGRFIVGPSGVLVTRVLYRKGKFVIVDTGMSEFIRPSLYGSEHPIREVKHKPGPEGTFDVVGPLCEGGDFIAHNVRLHDPQPGDILVIMGTGAYGMSMSSNYNSRPKVAEVLVDDDRAFIIREPETLEDLVVKETWHPIA